MNQRNIFISIFVLVIIIAGFLFLNRLKKNPSAQTEQVIKHMTVPYPKEVIVLLDKNGFSPKEVSVTVGTAVRWKNISGGKQTVNSDNYPTNQLYRELNFGIFSNGSSVVYTFKTPGIYGYHNQLRPEQRGTIIVDK